VGPANVDGVAVLVDADGRPDAGEASGELAVLPAAELTWT
jgi:hypothetical protein